MASNSVAANILMLLLLIGGLFAATRLRQEFLPEAELDSVFVTVVYPGASPKEVEQGIVLSIEESLRGIKGVKRSTPRPLRAAVRSLLIFAMAWMPIVWQMMCVMR